MKKISFLILIFSILLSCNYSSKEKKESSKSIKLGTQDETSKFDLFINKILSKGYTIDSLENKKNYSSIDSIYELNRIRKRIFVESNQKLILPIKNYKTILWDKNYTVKKAVIVEMIFNSEEEARLWNITFKNSKYKKIVESKPKTRLLINDNSIFFIQTYRDMKGKEIESLKRLMKENIN